MSFSIVILDIHFKCDEFEQLIADPWWSPLVTALGALGYQITLHSTERSDVEEVISMIDDITTVLLLCEPTSSLKILNTVRSTSSSSAQRNYSSVLLRILLCNYNVQLRINFNCLAL